MKICPVCGARAFDDALICYGCLYRYEEEREYLEEDQMHDIWADNSADDNVKIEMFASGKTAGEGAKESDLLGDVPKQVTFSAPEFLIRFKPVTSAAGDVTWSCSVEL